MNDIKIGKESRLIQDLNQGLTSAFDELFEKYSSIIFHFALSILKSKEDAEEIVQNTFLALWEKRQSVDHKQPFKPFIFTIAYNSTIDTFRRKAKEKKYRDYFLVNASIFYDQEEFQLSSDLLYNLDRIIDELPERRKQIFKLRKEKGLSHKEIADELSISTKTIENSINLAVKYIKSQINKGALSLLSLAYLFLQ